MCTEIGFQDVLVDTSNSEMQFELSEEEDEKPATATERTKIHGGSAEFRHLQDYDINSMCARVVVYGKKPEA